jgi:hypothetical protein
MKKKINDPFLNIKHMGYSMAVLPDNPTSINDFVRFAKFQICKERGFLYFDPIWDKYTDEQVLVEYYGIIYDKDENRRNEFLVTISRKNSEVDDIDWMDQEIEKNQKDVEKLKKEGFDFSPDMLGE